MENVSCEIAMSILYRKNQYKIDFSINRKMKKNRKQDDKLKKMQWKNNPRKTWASEVDFGWFLEVFWKYFGVQEGEKALPERAVFLSEKVEHKKSKKNRAQGAPPIIGTPNFNPLRSAGG